MKKDAKMINRKIRMYRSWIRQEIREYTTAKMIADSMANLVEVGWKIVVTNDVTFVPYNKKFQPSLVSFDRQVARIAKWTGKNPDVSIDKLNANARVLLTVTGKWQSTVWVRVESANTEQCEIEMIDVVKQEPRLTGYCAELVKKDYTRKRERAA